MGEGFASAEVSREEERVTRGVGPVTVEVALEGAFDVHGGPSLEIRVPASCFI